jgi:hypothetical protein
MKRIWLHVMIVALSIGLFPISTWAATITNTVVSYDALSRNLTVDGKLSSGVGKAVTLTVQDPNGELVVVDEKNSGLNGDFHFTHPLNENAQDGVYFVKVSGEEVTSVINKTFTVGNLQDQVAYLKGITVGDTPIEGFDPDTTSYQLHVASTVTTVTITAKLEQANATLKINNNAVADQTASSPITLQSGDNTITIQVTSKDGSTTKPYTVKVVKAGGNGGPTSTPPPTSPQSSSGSGMDTSSQTTTNGKVELTPVLSGNTAKINIEAAVLSKAFEQVSLDSKGNKTVQLTLKEVKGAKEYALELPRTVFRESKPYEVGSQQNVSIHSPMGTITIPDTMFKSKDLGTSSKISISIGQADTSGWKPELRAKIGNKPVLELGAYVDGKLLSWHNNQAPVNVSIAYAPTPDELKNPEHIVIWYVDGEGKINHIPSGKYDAATGKVTFTTTHFSSYAVAFEMKTFADLQQVAWAKAPIEVLASKGIVNGTTEFTFTPGAYVTRADFLKLLVGALDLYADIETNFDDVKPADYYYEAVGIAKALGISDGVGANQLNPKDLISRQDMMVMVERAMRVAGKDLSASNASALSRFQDANSIPSYAKDGLTVLLRNGLIEGEGEHLNPTSFTTRAEAAVLLYRVYNR